MDEYGEGPDHPTAREIVRHACFGAEKEMDDRLKRLKEELEKDAFCVQRCVKSEMIGEE